MTSSRSFAVLCCNDEDRRQHRRRLLLYFISVVNVWLSCSLAIIID